MRGKIATLNKDAEKKSSIGMWSVLFALLAIMFDYLFSSFSFTPIVCALRLKFIACTWAKPSEKSREPFAFQKKGKKKSNYTLPYTHTSIYIWIFMRTCFDSSCRSALAKPSCLSGFVRSFFSSFDTLRLFVSHFECWTNEKKWQQQGKCAFFLRS